MPYDPRPTAEGGNRGIDSDFTRNAPPGHFRVIGVDTFDGGDWVDGDFTSFREAQEHIKSKTYGKQMLRMYIYDDQGRYCDSAGTF